MKKTTISSILACILITLFMYTAIHKLADYSTYSTQVKYSTILGGMHSFITPFVPTLEFIITILLVPVRWRQKGFYLSVLLLGLFTIYLTALYFTEDIPCSCGGIFNSISKPTHILLNILFIAASIAGYRLEKSIKIEIEKTRFSITR